MTPAYKKKIAREILRIRLSQMIVNEYYKEGKFKIPVHLALGHEAIAVAVSEIMKGDDALILSHRNIAYNLAREGALKPILHEYLLKKTGLGGGALGSMNLENREKGIVYASSVLGNNFAVATGVAMATKMQKKNSVTIVLGGDGSMEEGTFSEALTLMKSTRVPALVIIENNKWSLGTRIHERRCPIDIAHIAAARRIRYAEFKGNNPYTYIRTLQTLRTYALQKQSPVCIEVHLATLGDWRLEHPDYPRGKYINYHAGPTPSVEITDWPLMKNTTQDPVYVLTRSHKEDALKKTARALARTLQREVI